MASKIERGAKVDLDEADCPDWALARLKSLRRSVLPAPLLLAPSNQVMDGGTGVWMAGHPWCTALKLTSPPSDAGLLRTIVPPGEKSMDRPFGQQLCATRGKGYRLENVIRHNLRTASGNSGSPLFLKNKLVAGIHAEMTIHRASCCRSFSSGIENLDHSFSHILRQLIR